MVVPRSSHPLSEDADFTLYSVTLFKKHASEFIARARANHFVPREFRWSDVAVAEDEREARDVAANERRLYADVLRLARTAHSDLFMAWTHVKALRVFVESVLRYGLPLEFVSAVIQVCPIPFSSFFPVFCGGGKADMGWGLRGLDESEEREGGQEGAG